MPANKEAIREWVGALRSGSYKQGHGTLRHGDRFCADGVACDLFAESIGYEWVRVSDFESYEYRTTGFFTIGSMPQKLLDYLGLPLGVRAGEDAMTTWSLNDQGCTLPEIANLLEQTYLGEEQRDGTG